MLPIYQLRLSILGVYGSAQGMVIAVHTPAFLRYPREYVVLTMYVNVVRTTVMVRMLLL
jgi:hypothetical protein